MTVSSFNWRKSLIKAEVYNKQKEEYNLLECHSKVGMMDKTLQISMIFVRNGFHGIVDYKYWQQSEFVRRQYFRDCSSALHSERKWCHSIQYFFFLFEIWSIFWVKLFQKKYWIVSDMMHFLPVQDNLVIARDKIRLYGYFILHMSPSYHSLFSAD